MTTVLFDPEPPIPDDVALNGRRVQDKFGIVADAGFQAVPDVLLLHQHELGLRSEDLNVLLQIATHWYLPETMPFLDLDHREAHGDQHTVGPAFDPAAGGARAHRQGQGQGKGRV